MVRSLMLAVWRGVSPVGRMRLFGCLTGLALLSACATQPQVNQSQEAAQYQARAQHNYTPPGPPGDPWGPYIDEASGRFDVPNQWIRAVMRVESGGQLYHNGELVTSWVGAMGLMQVMPETYDGLRERYGLGEDAYDPHNNLLAGTAYIREMYDLYGSPGFLAAYNAGPARLDDYLNNVRGLPEETRKYVAKAGPYVVGFYPERRSPAEELAMNQLPIDIPAGIRYPRPASHAYASSGSSHRTNPWSRSEERVAERDRGRGHDRRGETEVAELPPPPRMSPPPGRLALPAEPRVQTAMATSRGGGVHLIQPAAADTLPTHRGVPTSGKWAIQVGAFGNESQARSAADAARGGARDGRAEVGSVHQPKGTLFRARLTGMSRDAAISACEKMHKGNCIVLSPASQS